MNTYPLDPSLTHGAREYAYAPVCGFSFSGLLVIRQDSKAEVYAVEQAGDGFTAVWLDETGVAREGAYFPPSACSPLQYLVRKCGGETEGLYLVTLRERPSCQCYGYNRWQGCKHIDALRDALKRGLL